MHIKIRQAHPDDGPQIGQLIYDTIHAINIKDYNQEQINTWAPDRLIFSTYEDRYAYVAEHKGLIVGFGNLTSIGYLHRFYIHKDFQRQGIGTRLLEALEIQAKALNLQEITTEASITAKPFFLAKGWVVLTQQTKIFRGMSFINYKMFKNLSKP